MLSVFCGLILWYVVEVAEKFGVFNELKPTFESSSIILRILSAVVLAPLVEETVFRLSLGYYRSSVYFKWIFYFSAITFGQIHIINYQIDTTHYLFIPFITLSQTFTGLLFGFVRVVYGFGYAILLHSLHNVCCLTWYYVFGFDL